MKPLPPYYADAERLVWLMRERGGWQYVANRVGLTEASLRRVLKGNNTREQRKLAKHWFEQVRAVHDEFRRGKRAVAA